MLEVDVILSENYNEETEEFVRDSVRVRLEHSLVTVSKWESIWEIPFLDKKDKTPEQTLSYVKLMIVGGELAPEVFQKLLNNHSEQIEAFIKAPYSATKLRVDPNSPQSRETMTSELVYYWMISLNVPVEFQHWHFNRLITLLRVINLKNTPKEKMTLTQRRALNESRKAKYKTKG